MRKKGELPFDRSRHEHWVDANFVSSPFEEKRVSKILGGEEKRREEMSSFGRGRGGDENGGQRRGGGRRRPGRRGGRGGSIPEMTFLWGGNKRDPLNLSAVTPEQPVNRVVSDQIEIIVPRDIRDPLNLNKLDKMNRKRLAQAAASKTDGTEKVTMTNKRTRSSSVSNYSTGSGNDKIVSPIPPPNQSRKSHHSGRKQENRPASITPLPPSTSKPQESIIESSTTTIESSTTTTIVDPTLQKEHREHQKQKFRYGNFNRYYGHRLPGMQEHDPRLLLFDKAWFEKAAVLDIGCNVGFVTLQLAKEFSPRRILGIDIDSHLIGVARKNIRHYCDSTVPVNGKFPVSFGSRFGPLTAPSTSFSTKFPDNVWFRKENYVLDEDFKLDSIKEEYDVILALSITKWIHLNWGDAGLKRFFRRAFLQLKPNGRFILEAQEFASYRKRSKITAEMEANYKMIQFKPDAFHEFLMNEVGFHSSRQLGAPQAHVKGFQRPLTMYQKKISSVVTVPSEMMAKRDEKSEETSSDTQIPDENRHTDASSVV